MTNENINYHLFFIENHYFNQSFFEKDTIEMKIKTYVLYS